MFESRISEGAISWVEETSRENSSLVLGHRRWCEDNVDNIVSEQKQHLSEFSRDDHLFKKGEWETVAE